MINIAQNVGKQFENQFKFSVPDNVMYHRLTDDAQAFGTNDKLRFSKKSPCDVFLFKTPNFYTFELKSVSSNSISFERTKEEKGIIHYHQIKALENFSKYDCCISGFILNFRTVSHTYFIDINNFNAMINSIDKKSFNESDLLKHKPIIIQQTLLRTNYKYNIERFIKEIESKKA